MDAPSVLTYGLLAALLGFAGSVINIIFDQKHPTLKLISGTTINFIIGCFWTPDPVTITQIILLVLFGYINADIVTYWWKRR